MIAGAHRQYADEMMELRKVTSENRAEIVAQPQRVMNDMEELMARIRMETAGVLESGGVSSGGGLNDGMLTLREYGIKKIAEGLTTPEEVLALTDEHQIY